MLVICGDSWACGQWEVISWGHNSMTDLGFSRYFHENGRAVINVSQPGANQNDIYLRLRDLLRQNPHLAITTAIVFQTDITRDPLIYHPHWDLSWWQTRDKILHDWYDRLNLLAKEYSIRLLLIGGVGECDDPQLIKERYPNIEVACQSLTRLLVFDDPDTAAPVVGNWDVGAELQVNLMKSRSTPEEIEDLLDAIDLGHKRCDLWGEHKEWFFPDGMHPNQKAHEKLYHYLQKHYDL